MVTGCESTVVVSTCPSVRPAAADEWLAELDQAHGPVLLKRLEWAARLVERWHAKRRRVGWVLVR